MVSREERHKLALELINKLETKNQEMEAMSNKMRVMSSEALSLTEDIEACLTGFDDHPMEAYEET